jgi:hypothetical protein
MKEEDLMYNLRYIMRENQKKRLLVLRGLFDLSFGVPCIVSISIFCKVTEIDDYDVLEAARYLEEEGLLTIKEDVKDEWAGAPTPGPYLRLTHKGIVEVEQSITNPTEPTPNFPATVIHQYNNYNASVGAVQTGQYSTAHAVQNSSVEFPEAIKHTENLRQQIKSLPSESQEAATQLIGGLEDEFRLSQPRKARVRAFLKELYELTDKISVRKSLASLAKQYDIQL